MYIITTLKTKIIHKNKIKEKNSRVNKKFNDKLHVFRESKLSSFNIPCVPAGPEYPFIPL
jgi:hypothetical protein